MDRFSTAKGPMDCRHYIGAPSTCPYPARQSLRDGVRCMGCLLRPHDCTCTSDVPDRLLRSLGLTGREA